MSPIATIFQYLASLSALFVVLYGVKVCFIAFNDGWEVRSLMALGTFYTLLFEAAALAFTLGGA